MVIDEVFIIFLSIPIIFILVLLFNSIFKKNICAVCGAVSLTWILFLILYYWGYFKNQIILALLIGGTASGIFNLLKEKLGVFKLPFILTLFAFGYFLLMKIINFYVLSFLLFLWLIFGLIYIFSKKQNLQSLLQKLLECCKNW
ncbi:MAG: hypothetical protein KatS3mg095_0474 [Candidatus Parcubacteria bacterium]|nr:MAG: hypothetical protein KatS3mg095_0474 [Candidatus Parcubacteria bacterium]